ncbi:MAG: hypothetical protein QXI49_04600 [Candidatus Methanomethylicaceae archaeon]
MWILLEASLMTKGLAFFSGGKDSIFSIMKAMNNGIPIHYLLFNTHDFPRPNVHELNYNVVETIASLIGIPLCKLHLKKDLEYFQLYELFSKLNIKWIIVGTINAMDQLKWYDELCKKMNIKLYAPLHNEKNNILIEEIKSGIKAIVCDLDPLRLNKNLLGKVINFENFEEFSSIGFYGELGEYHTLVLEAPIMSGKIIPKKYNIIEKWGRCMLKINEFDVVKFL